MQRSYKKTTRNKATLKTKNKPSLAKKKTKRKTRGRYVRELDAWFSRYIRLKYADKNGMVRCFTSGEIVHWTKIQNGHFISRGNYKYRRDETNCHPQTYRENVLLKGNYTVYTLRMIDKYGEAKVRAMIEDKQLVKIPTAEIVSMIDYYKAIVKANPLFDK